MELKDGKVIITDDEKNILTSEQGKAFAKELGLVETVEKVVEKPVELTDEKVQEYLKGNQSLMDKIGNNIRTSFLAKKLGKDEKEVNDLLGKDIVLKDDLVNLQKQAIDTAIKYRLQGTKHPELLEKAITKDNIKWEDGKVVGLDEAVTQLQEVYKDLFTDNKGYKTPPPLPKGDSKIQAIDEEIKELSKKHTPMAKAMLFQKIKEKEQLLKKGDE